jgi:hypothetical protein
MTRAIAFLLLAHCCATLPGWAQERTSTTYVYDSEGRRVPWSTSTAGAGGATQTMRNANGREVPQEQVEEKVSTAPDGSKSVERLIRRFDANGQPLPPEKSVSVEKKNADGSTSLVTTVYRGDLNGRLAPSERTIVETRAAGDTTRSQMIVERPNVSGNLEPVERRVATTSGAAGQSETDELVYRKDSNSRFSEAARHVIRQRKENGVIVEQTDDFETASTGALQLSRQTVSRVTRNPDGTETRVVDVFGNNAPGRAVSKDGMQLRERQIIDRRPTPDGGFVESFSIQRPGLTASRELGPAKKISETVCSGKCAPPAPQP